jgi:hypothetical protein
LRSFQTWSNALRRFSFREAGDLQERIDFASASQRQESLGYLAGMALKG